MGFVVEDGTGRADATSYMTVAAADSYHDRMTGSQAWASASAAVKERALMAATQYLDIEYEGRWRGLKGDSEQALSWPRIGATDTDGYTIDTDVVPQKLQDACAELALRVVLGDELLGTVTEPGSVASESKSLGPLSKTVTYVGGKPHGYQYPKVEALLRGLIRPAGRVYRG